MLVVFTSQKSPTSLGLLLNYSRSSGAGYDTEAGMVCVSASAIGMAIVFRVESFRNAK